MNFFDFFLALFLTLRYYHTCLINQELRRSASSMAEQSAVNRSVVGSSPMLSAIYFGPLEKWLNSHAFHACIHGFESRTGHHNLYDMSDTFLVDD